MVVITHDGPAISQLASAIVGRNVADRIAKPFISQFVSAIGVRNADENTAAPFISHARFWPPKSVRASTWLDRGTGNDVRLY
ncbi:MAG: hypothetical protein DMF91_16930 [Acidobacteria bacterium]|nr:MAG: hypothetical protein DMF91_16930 [Acidobacteriota bacterium]